MVFRFGPGTRLELSQRLLLVLFCEFWPKKDKHSACVESTSLSSSSFPALLNQHLSGWTDVYLHTHKRGTKGFGPSCCEHISQKLRGEQCTNESDPQETRQISAAELETRVNRAEQTQRTVWSAASSKTGPGRGHLFSADPEARGRGDPLREHTVTEHLLPLTGTARQLLPALPPPSFPPSFPLPARHPCHPCPALPAPASPWALGHARHSPRSASAPIGAVAGQRAERRCPAPPRWVRRRCPAQPRRAPPASRGSSGPPVLLERAGGKSCKMNSQEVEWPWQVTQAL